MPPALLFILKWIADAGVQSLDFLQVQTNCVGPRSGFVPGSGIDPGFENINLCPLLHVHEEKASQKRYILISEPEIKIAVRVLAIVIQMSPKVINSLVFSLKAFATSSMK